jgi:hypothetical protein
VSDPDLDPLDGEERALAARLEAERPTVSHALRRRVRHRIGVAFHHRVLRRRSVALGAAGTALLAIAAALALTVPQ